MKLPSKDVKKLSVFRSFRNDVVNLDKNTRQKRKTPTLLDRVNKFKDSREPVRYGLSQPTPQAPFRKIVRKKFKNKPSIFSLQLPDLYGFRGRY